MISSERKSKMLNIYMSLIFISTLKGCMFFVPGIGSTVNVTYNLWNHNLNSSNETLGKNYIDKDIIFPLIDQLLLLEVLIWEFCPLELIVMRKLQITPSRICLWVSVHFLLSSLYITNWIMQMDGKGTCPLEIFLQMVSVLLVLAILGCSRILL